MCVRTTLRSTCTCTHVHILAIHVHVVCKACKMNIVEYFIYRCLCIPEHLFYVYKFVVQPFEQRKKHIHVYACAPRDKNTNASE